MLAIHLCTFHMLAEFPITTSPFILYEYSHVNLTNTIDISKKKNFKFKYQTAPIQYRTLILSGDKIHINLFIFYFNVTTSGYTLWIYKYYLLLIFKYLN